MLRVVHSCFFFFKQKTAYEMRISDWSSDVCSSDLRDDAIALDRLRHEPSPRQTVVHFDAAEPRALANSRGIIFDVRHAFRAARDHHVRRARLHHHCGLDDRLQSRTASAVELEARHRLRETRREPGPAPDARRFPARIALPENDIADPFGVDAAALDQGPEETRDRKSTRLNSSNYCQPRMQSSA